MALSDAYWHAPLGLVDTSTCTKFATCGGRQGKAWEAAHAKRILIQAFSLKAALFEEG